MADLFLQTELKIDYTNVPNSFIDNEMCDANGDFVKIYLYLLRCSSSLPQDFSISLIADKFNLTENDVSRALRYWEKKNLLKLTVENGNIIGISIMQPSKSSVYKKDESKNTSYSYYKPTSFSPSAREIAVSDGKSAEAPVVIRPGTAAVMNAYNAASAMKQDLSADEEYIAQEDSRLKEILILAETYLKKQLTSDDVTTIYYFYDTLHFSTDLIEFLIEHCVANDKRNMKYIEKVALSWAEKGIKTVAEAKKEISTSPNKDYFTILKAFGIRDRYPVDNEIEFMDKWLHVYHFDMEIIMEACARTMKKGNQAAPFIYADKILANWYKNGVITTKDIIEQDAIHNKNLSVKSSGNSGKQSFASSKTSRIQPITKPAGNNSFNNFEQRSTDYDALEEQLSRL